MTSEEQATKFLKDRLKEQDIESMIPNNINWVESDFYNNWDNIRAGMKTLFKDEVEYDTDQIPKFEKKFFLAHSKDSIKGKPQLIENVMKKILLMRMTYKTKERKQEKGSAEEPEKYRIANCLFFDERYDKRYDGVQTDTFALDVWIYRVVSTEGKEYYALSQKQLPNQTCEFSGMIVELDDFAEMSRSMKIKSLSRLFFVKDFEPDVKILTKEQLVTYTREREISENDWLDFLAYHELGNYNRFIKDVELLKSAFILSGKEAGWPMHLGVMGPTGTKKSMGHIETTAFKFSENAAIIEGGDSRIKGLAPSFKEKPANIGYLGKQERMGWIDEIGKMLEQESHKHNESQGNFLGELNFLLDHKRRLVGSGNDNDCEIQASAKFMFVTNPVKNKGTIYEHVGLIDPTTMSRILWWVQDEEEQKFALSVDSLVEVPPTPSQVYTTRREERKNLVLKKCWGEMCSKIESREEFLTLFDTVYSINATINVDEVHRIVAGTTALAKEPMKSSVWKPRAFHHIYLLVDGLCKHRCLFKDYNPDFIAIQGDYDTAERILIRMIKSWDTNLSPRREWHGNQ